MSAKLSALDVPLLTANFSTHMGSQSSTNSTTGDVTYITAFTTTDAQAFDSALESADCKAVDTTQRYPFVATDITTIECAFKSAVRGAFFATLDCSNYAALRTTVPSTAAIAN